MSLRECGLLLLVVPLLLSSFGLGHADAEARRSVLTALACANLVTFELLLVVPLLLSRFGLRVSG